MAKAFKEMISNLLSIRQRIEMSVKSTKQVRIRVRDTLTELALYLLEYVYTRLQVDHAEISCFANSLDVFFMVYFVTL